MSQRTSSTLFVFLAALLFSIGGLCIKLIPWNALAINGARNLISVVIIAVYLKITHHRVVINPAVIFGAVCMTGTTTLYVLANKLTTAANAIVLQFTAPAFVILLSLIIFRKKPGRTDIITCLCVCAGIVCFFVDSLTTGGTAGNIVAVLSGVCYAGVFMMNSFENSDSLSSILLGQALSAVIGIWFLFGESDFSFRPMLGIVLLGVFQLALAYIFMARGLEHTSPTAASLTSAIEPILNPILVAIFFGELITPLALVGAGIVIVSVVVYNIVAARSSAADTSQPSKEYRS